MIIEQGISERLVQDGQFAMEAWIWSFELFFVRFWTVLWAYALVVLLGLCFRLEHEGNLSFFVITYHVSTHLLNETAEL